MAVQWVAGFAVAHNYYIGAVDKRGKQLSINMDDIKYATDKYCRDHPLTHSLMVAAAEYVENIGGSTAYHNRVNKTQ